MQQLLSILDNAVLQSFSYGLAVVGVAVSFRVLRYPDLTPDGSFMVGAAVFAASLSSGSSWLLALVLSVCAGMAAGTVTVTISAWAGLNRLLSGILTTMICYSVAFRILAGRSNVGLTGLVTPFTRAEGLDGRPAWQALGLHPATIGVAAAFTLVLAVFTVVVLRSECGLLLRATGGNEQLVAHLGRQPRRYQMLGLAVANGLVSFSGGLVSARQGFVDVNMGVGIIITLIAALVLGEEVLGLLRRVSKSAPSWRVASALVGALVYYLLYLSILRASILGLVPIRVQPTDLKLLSAVIVICAVAWRSHRKRDHEDLGFSL